MCSKKAEEVEEALEGTVQYDDDELEARQLGFVTVHCKHATTPNTPPSNRSVACPVQCLLCLEVLHN